MYGRDYHLQEETISCIYSYSVYELLKKRETNALSSKEMSGDATVFFTPVT